LGLGVSIFAKATLDRSLPELGASPNGFDPTGRPHKLLAPFDHASVFAKASPDRQG